MSEPKIPPEAIERFLARCRAERIAQGKAPYITDPRVYNTIDGLLLGRSITTAAKN